MDVALVPFLGLWTLMMAAMMLPSAMPMILVHRRGVAGQARIQTELRTGIFVGAYVLVWGAAGIAVWIAARISDALLPMGARPFAVAAILLLAGAYQFTPLKSACLRVCRSPMDFLLTHWYPGVAGEVSLGLAHGLDGLNIVLYANWPAAIHEGNGIATCLVDERADEPQRTALRGLLEGSGGGPWAIFRKTFSELHGPRYVRYDVDAETHLPRVRAE